ncbi:MAG: 4-alpha-glucanotransferase [Desulfuromonadales bacterium]|nr:4-alpha-glucanotransferase [Desulfuromonadales bacterium]MBN2793531.1 4-alpha-glucanotransferase [Desulfuromonadales bacterium]
MLTQRRSGILLHPTSLPGPQPIGSLGKEAYDFVDFLVAARQSIWQILPLGPTGYGDCPYSCFSAFAGNPYLINLTLLVESGDLKRSDLPPPCASNDRVDFTMAQAKLLPLLKLAGDSFRTRQNSERRQQFENFCESQAFWLDDYALYQALRQAQDKGSWQAWPEEIKLRQPAALSAAADKLDADIFWHRYLQFVFFDQWFALKQYANQRGIRIIGDLPIFVAEDSADVWANQELFHLDEHGKPTLVAGVPPDYFSATGQRWGNPLYQWERMAEDNYSWWLARFEWNFQLFDLVRVDHFRGFASCWAIPADHPTAEYGNWMPAPGQTLFMTLQKQLSQLPIIAEDLGFITPDVIELRDRFDFPGMKILQFAFDSGSDNPYLPHNLSCNSVIYTGTHDNNTSLGWWQSLDAAGKQRIRDYLRNPCRDMPWPLIETALSSVSRMAIVPMQDVLSLPATSRMNIPGTADGNWQWRMRDEVLNPALSQRLGDVSYLYGRNLCNTTEM